MLLPTSAKRKRSAGTETALTRTEIDFKPKETDFNGYYLSFFQLLEEVVFKEVERNLFLLTDLSKHVFV